MMIEEQLRERLRKVETLHFGATTAEERETAGAAAERLKAKLDEAARLDSPTEMKFSLPEEWSVLLFVALCRRYGLRAFGYPPLVMFKIVPLQQRRNLSDPMNMKRALLLLAARGRAGAKCDRKEEMTGK